MLISYQIILHEIKYYNYKKNSNKTPSKFIGVIQILVCVQIFITKYCIKYVLICHLKYVYICNINLYTNH